MRLILKKNTQKFGLCVFMLYLCSVFPDDAAHGRRRAGRSGRGRRQETRCATRGWLKAPTSGRLVHPAEMPGIPPNTQLCTACDEVEDLKYEPSRCLSDMAFRLKSQLNFFEVRASRSSSGAAVTLKSELIF